MGSFEGIKCSIEFISQYFFYSSFFHFEVLLFYSLTPQSSRLKLTSSIAEQRAKCKWIKRSPYFARSVSSHATKNQSALLPSLALLTISETSNVSSYMAHFQRSVESKSTEPSQTNDSGLRPNVTSLRRPWRPRASRRPCIRMRRRVWVARENKPGINNGESAVGRGPHSRRGIEPRPGGRAAV